MVKPTRHKATIYARCPSCGLAFSYVKQSQQNLLNGPRAILFGAVI